MLIDWFTVVAQILNFLILVWLLRRFLYRPVLNAIDQREEKIQNQIEDAKRKREEAKAEQQEYQNKNKSFDEKRESMLREASEEAQEKRKELIQEARKEAENLRNRLEKSIREDHKNLNKEIMERTQREVFSISRKVLLDLASEDLESHMVQLFIRRLQDLGSDRREKFHDMLQHASRDVLIRTTFELQDTLQQQILEAIEDVSDTGVEARFEVAPEKISGIELTAGGYKLAWSVTDYLGSLEKTLSDLIYGENSHQEEPTSKASNHESIAG